MTDQKKPGPRKRLDAQKRFSTSLPDRHRAILDAYAEQHDISIAEALRRAIELLEKEGRGS